jgi:hypothetical protein
VGKNDGCEVGSGVGLRLGSEVGGMEGKPVGSDVGEGVGPAEGRNVNREGSGDGKRVGIGEVDGAGVGVDVGAQVYSKPTGLVTQHSCPIELPPKLIEESTPTSEGISPQKLFPFKLKGPKVKRPSSLGTEPPSRFLEKSKLLFITKFPISLGMRPEMSVLDR